MASEQELERLMEIQCSQLDRENTTLRARVAELTEELSKAKKVAIDVGIENNQKLIMEYADVKFRAEALQSRLTQLEGVLRLIRNLAMYENHHNELGHYVRIQRECDAALTPVVKQEPTK